MQQEIAMSSNTAKMKLERSVHNSRRRNRLLLFVIWYRNQWIKLNRINSFRYYDIWCVRQKKNKINGESMFTHSATEYISRKYTYISTHSTVNSELLCTICSVNGCIMWIVNMDICICTHELYSQFNWRSWRWTYWVRVYLIWLYAVRCTLYDSVPCMWIECVHQFCVWHDRKYNMAAKLSDRPRQIDESCV